MAIGLRQAPEPEGRPGHARVDTVHQGDRDGVKGLYLINLVDEVTQHEFVGAAVGISERFPVPLLEGLLLSFPFPILGFHADNGSEYINHRVAALLDKLRVERFTKSRARHSNDNALVEGKNANVVRKWFGHDHIPQRFAPEVNRFAQGTLSPFLNFHRPCLFAAEHRDGNGGIRRKYLAGDVMTPYARLRSIPGAEELLKPGLGFALLDAAAVAETDLEAARRVQAERHPRPQRGVAARPSRVRFAGQDASRSLANPPARLFPIVTTTPDSDRGVPSALDRRSAPARRHPRQPRSSRDWTRLTNVAIAPNIPRIAAGHPNNRPLHGSDNFTLTFSLDSGTRRKAPMTCIGPTASDDAEIANVRRKMSDTAVGNSLRRVRLPQGVHPIPRSHLTYPCCSKKNSVNV